MPAGGEVQPLVVEVEVTPAKMKNSVQMLSVCIVISIENGFLWVTKVELLLTSIIATTNDSANIGASLTSLRYNYK